MPNQPDPLAQAVNEGVEHALWQDLANALNRLSEWGIDPLLGLADRLGVNGIVTLDPGEAHPPSAWTYRLTYVPPFTTRDDDPTVHVSHGWTVSEATR